MRITRGNIARKRRKKILKLAKGFRGAHSSLFRTAKQQVYKSLKYAYIGRKNKKRNYRRLWIVRINAGLLNYGIKYSLFISLLKQAKISLNRKILSQLIFLDPRAFTSLLRQLI